MNQFIKVFYMYYLVIDISVKGFKLKLPFFPSMPVETEVDTYILPMSSYFLLTFF